MCMFTMTGVAAGEVAGVGATKVWNGGLLGGIGRGFGRLWSCVGDQEHGRIVRLLLARACYFCAVSLARVGAPR